MESSSHPAHDRGFHPLRVSKIIDETHDAKSIVFDVPAELRDAFRYEAGQFLTLEVPSNGVTLRRCYSLASSPHCDNEHKVTVKRVKDGRISNWVNDALKVGDVVPVKPPEGRFVLSKSEAPLLLFAGGSGITPVISILKTAMATTRRTARLLYANRDARSVIFDKELAALAQTYAGRVEIVHRLDDLHGFLAEADVRAYVAKEAECYLCGPGPFMDTVERGLLAAGIPSERLHVERFVSPQDPGARPAPIATPSAAGDVPDVIDITLKGKRVAVPYTAGKTILRAALDAGLDVPFSCEEGFCGCCVAQLTEGRVEMAADDALSKDEKKRGLVLTCQSCPKTAKCAVEYLDF